MSRCSVCDHERRDEIEEHLRAGRSLRLVARATGISKDALWRHQHAHNSLALQEATERRREGGDESGSEDGHDLGDLGDLRSSLLLMLEVAMQRGDFTRATGLARELRQTIIEAEKAEATKRLLGSGPTGPPTLHVVYDDPEFDLSKLTESERAVFERLLAKVEGRYEERFGSIAALDVEIRELEGELGSPAPLFDLSRLDGDDLAALERILAKALESVAEGARVLPEAGEDGSSGQGTIEAVVVELDEDEEES